MDRKTACAALTAVYRLSPVERSFGLAFTTLTIFAPLAHAAHPRQAIKPEGTASPLEFVATAPTPRGFALARQVLPAPATTPATTSAARVAGAARARSRVFYLNRDGAILRPGDNDSSRQRSSIVAQPSLVGGWDVDDDTWADTVGCVAEL